MQAEFKRCLIFWGKMEAVKVNLGRGIAWEAEAMLCKIFMLFRGYAKIKGQQWENEVCTLNLGKILDNITLYYNSGSQYSSKIC